MKRARVTLALLFAVSSAAAALASGAQTSASAGSNRYQRDGTAAATARYSGDIGSARTQTRSGSVNVARGVAWGLDESGLSLSVSNAIAPRNGPAVATTFNLSIGTDGCVSHSTGTSVARSSVYRSVSAGGSVGTTRRTAPTSFASGKTDRLGTVRTVTQANDLRPRPRIIRTETRRCRLVRR
jgi:hypothetical protein